MIRLAASLAVLVLGAGPAWADPASDAASEVVKQWGVPGAIIVVLATVIGYLGYALRASWQERFADRDKLSEVLERSIAGLADAKGAIANSVRAIEEQGRANDTRQASMQLLTASNASLEKAVDRALAAMGQAGGRT